MYCMFVHPFPSMHDLDPDLDCGLYRGDDPGKPSFPELVMHFLTNILVTCGRFENKEFNPRLAKLPLNSMLV